MTDWPRIITDMLAIIGIISVGKWCLALVDRMEARHLKRIRQRETDE